MIEQSVNPEDQYIQTIKERNKIHKEMPENAGEGQILSENYYYPA